MYVVTTDNTPPLNFLTHENITRSPGGTLLRQHTTMARSYRRTTTSTTLIDDVDADEILEVAKPYLGEFVSKHVAWHPTKELDLSLSGYGRKIPEKDDAWQFSTFCLGGGCL